MDEIDILNKHLRYSINDSLSHFSDSKQTYRICYENDGFLPKWVYYLLRDLAYPIMNKSNSFYIVDNHFIFIETDNIIIYFNRVYDLFEQFVVERLLFASKYVKEITDAKRRMNILKEVQRHLRYILELMDHLKPETTNDYLDMKNLLARADNC